MGSDLVRANIPPLSGKENVQGLPDRGGSSRPWELTETFESEKATMKAVQAAAPTAATPEVC
jgi:hypothetical protein